MKDKYQQNISTVKPAPRASGSSSMLSKDVYTLQTMRDLNDSTYVLRFDRNDMVFQAGQHLTVGVAGSHQTREYSIYSTEADPFLEILIREVKGGSVSQALHKCRPGDRLNVKGPFGLFTLNTNDHPDSGVLFVATGTGIAPFHSMVGSVNGLNYRILHGIRSQEDAYELEAYERKRYVSCSSRDLRCDFNGRVTDYIQQHPVDPQTWVYLCGNCDMIHDVYDILLSQGVSPTQIQTEVYF
jgi:ferredoxin--NADP+ reductase/benzoate/toluate 1,2-dioxygenase reductase subunit